MIRHLAFAAALLAGPAAAQDAEPQGAPSPGEIVAQAQPSEWVTIAPEDLLVMTLAPATDGKERRVVIQLMPPPFSQPWVANIRTLARAHWWDGLAIVRVQDNYVVQWGDPEGEDEAKARPLPEGLRATSECDYAIEFFKSDIVTDHCDWLKFERAKSNPDQETLLEAAAADAEANAAAMAEAAEDAVDAVQEATEEAASSIASLDDQGTDQPSEMLSDWWTRDPYSNGTAMTEGWPVAFDYDTGMMWPVHCYGMVGVGRGMSPDAGTGAELYTVIGHAPRHLDRNIAVVGRVVQGIEHLSSLPRGTGPLGFYEDPAQRVPIASIRLVSELPEAERPRFEYLDTEGETFARYADARANRRDPFFIVPAGGADVCNIPVPVRPSTGSG